MNIEEAKKIWGDAMPDEDLNKWLELRNKIKPDLHDPKIPKGATVEIDEPTDEQNIVWEIPELEPVSA